MVKSEHYNIHHTDKLVCRIRQAVLPGVMERGREGGGRGDSERDGGGGGEQPATSRDPWGRREEVDLISQCNTNPISHDIIPLPDMI